MEVNETIFLPSLSKIMLLECGLEEFLKWDKYSSCFTKTWDTPEKREKLWCTCNRPGREIGSLLMYGIAQITNSSMKLGIDGCNTEDIVYVRETLKEGHETVPDLKIYALLSEGEFTVPEAYLVPGLIWYNENCALNDQEMIDGVAVNNEDYPDGESEGRLVEYITNLNRISMFYITSRYLNLTIMFRFQCWFHVVDTLLCWEKVAWRW